LLENDFHGNVTDVHTRHLIVLVLAPTLGRKIILVTEGSLIHKNIARRRSNNIVAWKLLLVSFSRNWIPWCKKGVLEPGGKVWKVPGLTVRITFLAIPMRVRSFKYSHPRIRDAAHCTSLRRNTL